MTTDTRATWTHGMGEDEGGHCMACAMEGEDLDVGPHTPEWCGETDTDPDGETAFFCYCGHTVEPAE